MAYKKREELLREVEELRTQMSKQNAALAATHMTTQTGTTMVPIKNYGGTVVSVTYDILGSPRSLLLEPQGLKSTGSIPLERWMELERGSKLVSLGYIARTDIPTDNPNVIEDVERFAEDIKETDVVARIAQIENPNVLYRINDFLALKKDLSGLELFLLAAVRDRIFDLTEVRLTSVDPMGE